MTSIQIDIKDGLSSSTAVKGPCRVATTANITLSGEQTIDGVAVVTDDRVLVKDQTAGSENGIYVVDTGAWRRSKDFNKTKDVKCGTLVIVAGGTVGTGLWQVSTADPITIDTTSISFVLVSNASLVGSTADVRNYLDVAPYVATRAALKALDTTKDTVAILTESGREGIFLWKTGDYSAQVTSDTQEGIYVKATAIASSSGAWVRNYVGPVWVEWFGAVGDGATDDSTAINAALTLVSDNGHVRLKGVTYAVGTMIGVYKGQVLEGATSPGDVFGAIINPGTALKWTGATGGTVLTFGADPAIVTGQIKPKGGGLRNLQIYGGTTANVLWRISSCDNARFQDIKLVSLRDNSSATCLYGLPNTTEAGFENTTRFCTFDRITMFAYGAGHGLRNFTNGTEGGFTFCRFTNLFCEFGGNTGAGNAYYFSSMDDCVFTLLDASRLAGGTGQGLYLDGNAVSGKVAYGNTFNFVKMSGGCPVLADGRYSSGNKIYGLSGVDEVPTVLQTNNGWIDVDYLGTTYGDTPGTVSQQPTTVRAKDASNTSVTRMLTLSHDLNAAASAPTAGIGTSLAFEVLTGTGNKELAAVLEASMTDVTSTAEISKLVLKLMSAGTSTSFVTFTPTLVSMVGTNPSYYIESTGVGAGASAGISMKTGNSANVWQAITKAGTYVVGIQSVADYLTLDTSGNLSQNGAVKSSHATAGVGYATGAGGTVTQATSKATGVTLNKATGQITLNAAALAASTTVSFVLTSSAIAATDLLVLNHVSGGTPGSYTLNGRAAAGSATIDVRNVSLGSLSEAIVIGYAVVKAVTA